MKVSEPLVQRELAVVSLLAIMVSRSLDIDVSTDGKDAVVRFRDVDKDLLAKVEEVIDEYFEGEMEI